VAITSPVRPSINWVPSAAESSLLCAQMAAAIADLAEVESLTIHHDQGVVDVEVQLPAELIERERDLRGAWVLDRLEDVVEHAFAAEGLRLGQVHFV
jgi:hypothetical protein